MHQVVVYATAQSCVLPVVVLVSVRCQLIFAVPELFVCCASTLPIVTCVVGSEQSAEVTVIGHSHGMTATEMAPEEESVTRLNAIHKERLDTV